VSAPDTSVATPGLPRVSPSRLEAWDRCPAAYRFEYVLRLSQPVGDQRPRLLGSAAHALLEEYLDETVRTGTRPELARVPAIATGLLEQGGVPDASTDLMREAASLVTRWLAQWTVPVEHVLAVERALAVDRSGTHVGWDAPEAFIRGRLDLITVAGPHATVLDWKSGWLSEDEEDLRVAWAPALYAALLWAWAPRLRDVSVEYHYLRTGRITRVAVTRAEAAETLAWARALASRIAAALAARDEPGAFPPRPSTACATCPWMNRCPAGQAALEAMDEVAIPDDAEARRLAGLLLVGEARVGRLRARLKHYLEDRDPLAVDDLEVGFFPTSGRYDPQGVARGGRSGRRSLAAPLRGRAPPASALQTAASAGGRPRPGAHADPALVRAPEGQAGARGDAGARAVQRRLAGCAGTRVRRLASARYPVMDRVKRRWTPDPGEEDRTGRPRQEDRTRQCSHCRTARHAPGPAILIVGTWSGEALPRLSLPGPGTEADAQRVASTGNDRKLEPFRPPSQLAAGYGGSGDDVPSGRLSGFVRAATLSTREVRPS
jgi:RecB family exonuclease